MVEFYQAYADYNDLMDLTQLMLRYIATEVMGTLAITYQGQVYDLSKDFDRLTMLEAIVKYNDAIQLSQLTGFDAARALAHGLGIEVKPGWGLGKLQTEIFEATTESQLQQPTFITQYPAEVSPLARRDDQNPDVTDRFEFFICGRELANGFSELNDPEDQAARFRQQVQNKQGGDDEAMHFDTDYIRALEHGLPPTAGEGIGVDRLVMFLTDSASIRDVILFPLMRPE